MKYLTLSKEAPTNMVQLFGITIIKGEEVECNINSRDLKALLRIPYITVVERNEELNEMVTEDSNDQDTFTEADASEADAPEADAPEADTPEEVIDLNKMTKQELVEHGVKLGLGESIEPAMTKKELIKLFNN